MKKHLSQILRDNVGISEEDYEEVQRIRMEKGGNTGEILIKKNSLQKRNCLKH